MSPSLAFCEFLPLVVAMSLYALSTPLMVRRCCTTSVFCVALLLTATMPRSPSSLRESLMRCSVRPVAAARALMRVASPMPSSMPRWAGATRLVHRYTAGSRSSGVVAMMARKQLTSRLTISSLLLVSAIASKVSARNSNGTACASFHLPPTSSSTLTPSCLAAAAMAPCPTPSILDAGLVLTLLPELLALLAGRSSSCPSSSSSPSLPSATSSSSSAPFLPFASLPDAFLPAAPAALALGLGSGLAKIEAIFLAGAAACSSGASTSIWPSASAPDFTSPWAAAPSATKAAAEASASVAEALAPSAFTGTVEAATPLLGAFLLGVLLAACCFLLNMSANFFWSALSSFLATGSAEEAAAASASWVLAGLVVAGSEGRASSRSSSSSFMSLGTSLLAGLSSITCFNLLRFFVTSATSGLGVGSASPKMFSFATSVPVAGRLASTTSLVALVPADAGFAKNEFIVFCFIRSSGQRYDAHRT
mmetsp:Transcript_25442/g.55244  ORF Transcript_25442/g.55244 Transcript_25442/m.55244 type:complete len:479 (-) Transcript_25442:208-1644(-)